MDIITLDLSLFMDQVILIMHFRILSHDYNYYYLHLIFHLYYYSID
jgi:hypothetical protein